MTETIINGDAFNIIVEGAADAPAILLVHSLGTNLHVFDRQVAALTPHFRLVRFDARGHGGSRVSEGPYSIDQLGKDALAILDALKIDKAHVVGLSAGGLIGLWLLRYAPERVDRAVLANVAAQIGNAISGTSAFAWWQQTVLARCAKRRRELVYPAISRAAPRSRRAF